MMSSEKYTPGEEDFVDSYAFEPGWNGYSDEKAAEARRGIEKIKTAARAEAFNDARHNMQMSLDAAIKPIQADAWDEGASDGQWNLEHEGQIERGTRQPITNPYRENGDNND